MSDVDFMNFPLVGHQVPRRLACSALVLRTRASLWHFSGRDLGSGEACERLLMGEASPLHTAALVVPFQEQGLHGLLTDEDSFHRGLYDGHAVSFVH